MRIAKPNLAVAIALASTLAACASVKPMVSADRPSYVGKVEVSMKTTAATPGFSDSLRRATRAEAARYGGAGDVKHVRVEVLDVHYKNPALSLLIGDANHVRARMAVIDAVSGRSHGEAEVSAVDNLAINGVVGAVMAAAQDRTKVDGRLAEKLASDVMEHVYGSAAAAEARKRPLVAVADEPAAAPAPAEMPKSAPKGAPKAAPKRAEPKTAMAVPTPAAR